MYAISFGSTAKSSYEKIEVGDSAKFQILFWNSGSEAYTVKISVASSPENWVVIADPEMFVLDNSTGEEYVSVPPSTVKAKVVNLFVKPDSSISEARGRGSSARSCRGRTC